VACTHLILQLVAGIHCGFLLLRCASPAGVVFLFENKVELVNAFDCKVVACCLLPVADSRQPAAGSWWLVAGGWSPAADKFGRRGATERPPAGGLFLFLSYKFRISDGENKPAKYV
jgi:hypothetical protein